MQWTDWFGGLTITLEENGDTLLTGPVVDQAALYGLLKKVRNLGMPLVSVRSSRTRPGGNSRDRAVKSTRITHKRRLSNEHLSQDRHHGGSVIHYRDVAGVLSVVVSGPARDQARYLVDVSSNANQITVGALLVLLMGLALAMVPVVMFPLFKKYNEVLALGCVVFRGALETVIYIAMTIGWLVLIALSLEYVKAGTPDAAYFQTLGAILLAGIDATSTILIIIFGLGALMLYMIFYRSRLIPRWLSIWGLIAIILHLITAFLIMFRLASTLSPVIGAVDFPIFLQEMVMAVWLRIVKGFESRGHRCRGR